MAETGVDPARETETFAQVTLEIENWRWADVPFVLRTGKALENSRRAIVVHFRPVPHLAFGQEEEPAPNALLLGLDPDRISLSVSVNGRDDPFTLEPLELDASLAPQALPAYGHVLLGVLASDSTLSIRGDEAEEAWRIVEPILAAWAEGRPALSEYPAGSAGPPPPTEQPVGG